MYSKISAYSEGARYERKAFLAKVRGFAKAGTSEQQHVAKYFESWILARQKRYKKL